MALLTKDLPPSPLAESFSELTLLPLVSVRVSVKMALFSPTSDSGSSFLTSFLGRPLSRAAGAFLTFLAAGDLILESALSLSLMASVLTSQLASRVSSEALRFLNVLGSIAAVVLA
mgnify:CR=1 FL=1